MEPFQILKYEPGQFYKVHHDQNSPRTSAWGPRMYTVFVGLEPARRACAGVPPLTWAWHGDCTCRYTFFMYLNDGAEGGETHFPRCAPYT